MKTATQVIPAAQWDNKPGKVWSFSKNKFVFFQSTHIRIEEVKLISDVWVYNSKNDAFYRPEWLENYMETLPTAEQKIEAEIADDEFQAWSEMYHRHLIEQKNDEEAFEMTHRGGFQSYGEYCQTLK